MIHDSATLLTSSSFVAAVGGAFLILAWYGQREATPMLWWGIGNLAFAAGFPLVLEGGGGQLPTMIGGALFALGPGLIWASSRDANQRSIDPVFISVGPILWLAAFLIPGFSQLPGAQAALNQAVVAVYMFVAAAEFFDRARQTGSARQPLVVLLTIHGLFFAYGAFEATIGGLAAPVDLRGFWLVLIHFETLIFVIGTSMFAVAMAREQRELARIVHANTDELTGLANRRAFYNGAAAFFSDGAPAQGELSVILFDLDAFKGINDRFGHAVGDRVLGSFGEAVRKALRGTDVIGRIGGEEFAAIVPSANAERAREIGDRVRTGFAAACKLLEIPDLHPTLSGGVAQSDGTANLDALLGRADVALYRAKAAGRDRIEVFDRALEPAPSTELPRARKTAA